MVAEFFHGTPINEWGTCIKRWPWVYIKGFVFGSVVFITISAVVIGWQQDGGNDYRPTLKLVESTIFPGGYLGFYQGATPDRRCPQETVRMVWRQKTPTEREVYPIGDFNVVPNFWEGRSVVFIQVPHDLPPGDWFYLRETAQWCSWWSFMTRPKISRTTDVPFTVVPRGNPKG
jgi:hypothetical protein